MKIHGSRILICQPMMYSFTGSTMVTLELSEYLQSAGAEVTIFTDIFDEPIKSIAQKKRLKVVCFDDDPELHLDTFDLIWIHSQILPKSIISDLKTIKDKKLPAFVFLHMSPLDYCADEKAWIYGFEEKMSDLSLAISDTTKLAINKNLNKEIHFFRNPAPAVFAGIKRKRVESLKNILIVSNHPPREVIEACNILKRDYKINTTLLGQDGKYRPVTPGLLSKYDLVITIGKTVQYCLVSGTPVYIYDRFGGDGYLNNKNFEENKSTNFSGNFMAEDRKRFAGPEELAKDIFEHYSSAVLYQKSQISNFQEDFLINKVLPRLLRNLSVSKKTSLSEEYVSYLEMCQNLARHCIFYGMYDAHRTRFRLKESTALADDLRKENEKISNDIAEIKSARSYKIIKKVHLILFGRH